MHEGEGVWLILISRAGSLKRDAAMALDRREMLVGVLGCRVRRLVHVATAMRAPALAVLGKGEHPGPLLVVPFRLDIDRVADRTAVTVVVGPGDLPRFPA
jgi:hypothetical protein